MDKSDGGIAEGTWRDGTGAGSDKRASVGDGGRELEGKSRELH